MLFYPMFYDMAGYRHAILSAEGYEELDMVLDAIRRTTTIPEEDVLRLLELGKSIRY